MTNQTKSKQDPRITAISALGAMLSEGVVDTSHVKLSEVAIGFGIAAGIEWAMHSPEYVQWLGTRDKNISRNNFYTLMDLIEKTFPANGNSDAS